MSEGEERRHSDTNVSSMLGQNLIRFMCVEREFKPWPARLVHIIMCMYTKHIPSLLCVHAATCMCTSTCIGYFLPMCVCMSRWG